MKYINDMTADEKRALIRRSGGAQQLLNVLLDLQSQTKENCLDGETIELVARELSIPVGRIKECISYYAMLNSEPTGRYVLEICSSTPCYISKGAVVEHVLADKLGICVGETTEDGVFSIRTTPCVGACEIGPVIKIGDEIFGNLTPEKICALIDDLYTKAKESGVKADV